MNTAEFDERNLAKSRAVCEAIGAEGRRNRCTATYDRDALLALADEMEKSSDRRKLRSYVRRLREACGVG